MKTDFPSSFTYWPVYQCAPLRTDRENKDMAEHLRNIEKLRSILLRRRWSRHSRPPWTTGGVRGDIGRLRIQKRALDLKGQILKDFDLLLERYVMWFFQLLILRFSFPVSPLFIPAGFLFQTRTQIVDNPRLQSTFQFFQSSFSYRSYTNYSQITSLLNSLEATRSDSESSRTSRGSRGMQCNAMVAHNEKGYRSLS